MKDQSELTQTDIVIISLALSDYFQKARSGGPVGTKGHPATAESISTLYHKISGHLGSMLCASQESCVLGASK